jgi:hypothetical protein
MSIDLAAPPRIRPRKQYAEAMKQVMAVPGQWVRLSLDEVTGLSNRDKQAGIWSAANIRKVKVQTTVQDGFLYVRQIVGA